MMPIAYKAPAISEANTARAAQLTGKMKSLVAQLSTWAAKGHKYAILTPAQRLELVQGGYPNSLVANVAFFTEQLRVPYGGSFVTRDEVMVGFTANAFDPELYASDAIKSALIDSHRGRCAYCESLINHTTYGDVEHFRPKAGYTSSPSPVLFRPGYYFLAYDPRNLLYSCQLCNEAYKQNNFPVLGARVPEVTVDAETPILINPYAENPRNFIRFNPVNGSAYPWDLVQAFYTQTRGWGPPQTEQEIWRDPAKIPGQKDFTGRDISNPDVDRAFDTWLAGQTNPALQRGIRNISTLNLNRRPLLRARISHLRHLRGLCWTASSTGIDQAAAAQLLQYLLGTEPNRATVAPEFLSLSIDALQTWQNSLTTANGTVDSYNRTLALFLPAPDLVAPSPHNDALMYLVLENELQVTGRRRIVYLTDKDRVYGSVTGQKGIFLAIDWDVELDYAVVLKGARQEYRTTLRQLITDDPLQLWRKFKYNNVWAVGEFLPIRPAG